MDFDWKSVVKTVAPWLGNAIGGPLGGVAMRKLAGAVLGDEDASEDQLAEAIAKATPEQLLAIKNADHEFEKSMRELGIKEQALYVDDTRNARETHKGDPAVFRLGIAVLVTFALVMGVALYGAYEILTGGMQIKEVGMVAAVFGLIGTIVGYVAGNAQQVVAFFFGSSAGSKQKTEAMAASLASFGKAGR